MSYFPDMGRNSLVAAGEHIRAVGWLHPDHPYTKGEVSAEFVCRLKEFTTRWGASAEALWFGAFGGFHTREFCGKSLGIGNFGVPRGDLLFVAPEMIVHYIEQHGYGPPAEFVAAVLQSPLPDSDEYQLLTEPFYHLHKKACERRHQEAINRAGRWASERGGTDDAVNQAALRFFGNSSPEMRERILRSMENV